MAEPSPLDVIASGRWRSALFTTYALSLTFFESVVLRALHAAGCHDVWVVVDADGYQQSLMERRSRRVGQEYRLIPVALPRGVFHAKCTYLAGDENDALMVGSGNLTFGGYGRNLEVLEVLDPQHAPGVFLGFAEFLDAVGGRADLVCADRTWITQFAAISRRRGSRAESTLDQPRLVHSVDRPILEAIRDAVEEPNFGSVQGRELFVLSPFHDGDGDSVRKLADATQCSRIAVGLPTNADDEATFPFLAAAGWDASIRAVRPVADEPKRPLHAKWIEVRSNDRSLTVTGSVNSTKNALVTIRNVEAAVLRVDREPRIIWEGARAPQQVTVSPRQPAGLGAKVLVHALLRSDGTLTGQILASRNPVGHWEGQILRPDARSEKVAAEVDPDGRFRCRTRVSPELAWAPALQIELSSGDRTARGWVHQDDLLRMAKLPGISAGALARWASGEHTDDDSVALLDYLASKSTQHLAAFQRPIREAAGSSRAESPLDIDISISDLRPDPSMPSQSSDVDDLANRSEPAIVRFFSVLRARLLGREGSDGVSRLDGSDSGGDSAEDEIEHRRRAKRFGDALSYFERRVQELVEKSSGSERSALLTIWLEVKLHILVRRLGERDEALAFLKPWFLKASDCADRASQPDALEQHLFTVGALLACHALESPSSGDELGRIHQALEHYCRGAVDTDRAQTCASEGAAAFYAGELNSLAGNLPAALDRVIAARTPRGRVQEAIDCAGRAQSPLRNDPLFASAAGQRFLTNLEDSDWSDSVANGSRPVCAHCSRTLTPAAEIDLQRRRYADCGSCGNFTVRLEA